MSARSRSRSSAPIQGRYRYGASSDWSTVNCVPSQEVCEDTVGQKDQDNPFLLTYTYRDPAIANATGNYLGGSHSSMENLPIYSGAVDLTHLPLDTAPSNSAAATTGAARTNPSRAHVALPVAIFELKDVPGLIRKFGRDSLANAGDLNLRWQFGLAPMIADLRRLANFQAVASKRAQELDSLSQKGGLRRKATIFDDTQGARGTSNPIYSVPYGIRYTYYRLTRKTVWTTSRWRPSAAFTSLSPKERDAQMRRMLLGLSVSQVTSNLWEALPWSWLIDWFSNCGELIQANNNSVAHLAGQCCVMTHHRTTYSGTAISGDSRWKTNGSFTKPTGSFERGTKSRALATPSFSASIPFLTGRQLSIIGSLAATRVATK